MTDDIDQLEQLTNTYCHRVDRGTAAEVSALFAPDAVLVPRYDGDYQQLGRAEIERWYAFYHENFRAAVRHLKHMVMSPMFELDGERASGVIYLLASAVNRDSGEAMFVTGTYHDEYVRTNDGWLFARRTIDVEAMSPMGPAIETFPPLNFPASG